MTFSFKYYEINYLAIREFRNDGYFDKETKRKKEKEKRKVESLDKRNLNVAT